MQNVPYTSVMGSLIYVMICTRLDITYDVGIISHFLLKLGREYWNTIKWILKYLIGTSNISLCFGSEKPILVGYTNFDMAKNIDSRKSTLGYLITFTMRVVA